MRTHLIELRGELSARFQAQEWFFNRFRLLGIKREYVLLTEESTFMEIRSEFPCLTEYPEGVAIIFHYDCNITIIANPHPVRSRQIA